MSKIKHRHTGNSSLLPVYFDHLKKVNEVIFLVRLPSCHIQTYFWSILMFVSDNCKLVTVKKQHKWHWWYLANLVFGKNCRKIGENTSGPESMKWWHQWCHHFMLHFVFICSNQKAVFVGGVPNIMSDHTWQWTVHGDHYVIGNLPRVGSDWGFM